jgi:hypothetical protein
VQYLLRSKRPQAMNLELEDTERAALVELVSAAVKATRYPLSPELRLLRSVLAKLGAGSPKPATVYPAPKPPGEPSAVLAKGKRQR